MYPFIGYKALVYHKNPYAIIMHLDHCSYTADGVRQKSSSDDAQSYISIIVKEKAQVKAYNVAHTETPDLLFSCG